MEPPKLRSLVLSQITKDAYPERLNLPYVVGAFLWDERSQLLAPHLGGGGTYAAYDRVAREVDMDYFLINGRSPGQNFTLPNGTATRVDELLGDYLTAAAVFDTCLEAGEDFIKHHRQQLHQLDLYLHGRSPYQGQ